MAEERSLNRAAKRIGMAYSKAWRIIKEAEEQLGCELLARNGARGSTLTDDGQRVLAAYRQLEQELNDLLDRRLPELLAKPPPAAPCRYEKNARRPMMMSTIPPTISHADRNERQAVGLPAASPHSTQTS